MVKVVLHRLYKILNWFNDVREWIQNVKLVKGFLLNSYLLKSK